MNRIGMAIVTGITGMAAGMNGTIDGGMRTITVTGVIRGRIGATGIQIEIDRFNRGEFMTTTNGDFKFSSLTGGSHRRTDEAMLARKERFNQISAQRRD